MARRDAIDTQQEISTLQSRVEFLEEQAKLAITRQGGALRLSEYLITALEVLLDGDAQQVNITGTKKIVYINGIRVIIDPFNYIVKFEDPSDTVAPETVTFDDNVRLDDASRRRILGFKYEVKTGVRESEFWAGTGQHDLDPASLVETHPRGIPGLPVHDGSAS